MPPTQRPPGHRLLLAVQPSSPLLKVYSGTTALSGTLPTNSEGFLLPSGLWVTQLQNLILESAS